MINSTSTQPPPLGSLLMQPVYDGSSRRYSVHTNMAISNAAPAGIRTSSSDDKIPLSSPMMAKELLSKTGYANSSTPKNKQRKMGDIARGKMTLCKALMKNRKKHQCKSVRFSPKSNTIHTLPQERTSMTVLEQQQAWYQSQDYAAVHADALKNLRALQCVSGDLIKLQENSGYCMRGLEMKTSPHINRLRRLRLSITVRAVLDSQKHYRSMRMRRKEDKVASMEYSLAAVYDRYTQKAKNRARELGLIDSIEAKRLALS